MMWMWVTGTVIALAVFGVGGVFATRGEAWFALGLVIGEVLHKLSKFNNYCKRQALKFYWLCYDIHQNLKWQLERLKRKIRA